MRARIIAAAAAAFFQATLAGSAPSLAQSASGIREEVLTIFGEPRAAARTRTINPSVSALAGEAGTPPSFTYGQTTPNVMSYSSCYDWEYGALEAHILCMFLDEMGEVHVENEGPEGPAVTQEPSVTLGEIFTNKETQDSLFQALLHAPLSPFGPTSQSREAALPRTLFVASIAASSINATDKALFIAAIPVVQRKLDVAHAKLFRIQLTKVATDKHFCTPASNAFVLAPRMAGNRVGRLFIAFDSSSGGTVGSVLSLDMAALIAGGAVKVKCFIGANLAGLMPPSVRDQNAMAYFVAAPLAGGNVIKRFKFLTGATIANDRLVATPNINVTPYDMAPAAVQPNGAHLYSGGAEFNTPGVQIGNMFWNVHVVNGAGDHPKVRLYKFSATGANPLMTLTLNTGSGHDLFSPSLDVMTSPMNRAYVTFARTIRTDPTNGKATIMQAKGPNGSAAGWNSVVVTKSNAQISKNFLGNPCDPFAFAGCAFMANTGTLIDPVNGLVWSIGPQIIGGDGTGKETNWQIRGVGKSQ